MRSSPDDPAARLYADASRGDGAAAIELLREYLPRLRAFVRARLDPELRRRESDSDVVQSVCRELLEHRDSFRYQGESQFRGWLFTAAVNKTREKFRFHHQARRDLRSEQDRDEERSNVAPVDRRSCAAPSHAALAAERAAILEAALDRLSETDREIIGLARLAGLPMKEVAARLGKNLAAARRQLGRALLRLSVELGRDRAAGNLE